MKRWIAGLILVLLCCIPIMIAHTQALAGASAAVLCIGLFYWLLREVLEQVSVAVVGAAMLAITLGVPVPVLAWTVLAIGLAAFAGLLIPNRGRGGAVLAALASFLMFLELTQMQRWGDEEQLWLRHGEPLISSIFVLASLALYAKYVRQQSPLPRKDPTALDIPATRSTESPIAFTSGDSRWAAASIASAAVASWYSPQAWTSPLLAVGIALMLRSRGYRPRWALIGIYTVAALAIPIAESTLLFVEPKAAPVSIDGPTLIPILLFPTTGLLQRAFLWGSSKLLLAVLGLVATFTGLVLVFGRHKWALIAFAISVVPLLAPYEDIRTGLFLPMALRAIFIVGLGVVFLEQVKSAWSRPAMQAPPRLSPAPGSLLRQ